MEKLEEPIDYAEIDWNKYCIKGINGNLYLVRYGRDIYTADERESCIHCRRKIKSEMMRKHMATATCQEFQERNERIKKYGRKKPGVKPQVPSLSQLIQNGNM